LRFQKRVCPTDNAAFIAMLFFLSNLAADPARQMEQPPRFQKLSSTRFLFYRHPTMGQPYCERVFLLMNALRFVNANLFTNGLARFDIQHSQSK